MCGEKGGVKGEEVLREVVTSGSLILEEKYNIKIYEALYIPFGILLQNTITSKKNSIFVRVIFLPYVLSSFSCVAMTLP